MLKSIFIPVIIMSLITVALVSEVTKNNTIEYYENSEHARTNTVKGTKSSFNFQTSNLTDQSVTISNSTKITPRFKTIEPNLNTNKVTKKESKTIKKNKKNIKGSKKSKSFTFKSPKKIKKKKQLKRKPSKAEKANERKIEVPKNLPQVNENVFSTFGTNQISSSVTKLSPPANIVTNSNITTTSPVNKSNTITNEEIENNIETIESQLISSRALIALNNFISGQINTISPQIKKQMIFEMSTALESYFNENKDYGIKLNKVKKVDFVLNEIPFGVDTFGKDGLIFKFPLKGSWNIKFHVNVHFENDVFTTDEDIIISLNRFNLNIPFRVQKNSEGQINIVQSYKKQLGYELNINSSSFLINTLLDVFTSFHPEFMQDKISDFTQKLALDIAPLVNKTQTPFITKIANDLADDVPENLEQIVQNIDEKILTQHMQLSTVHSIESDKSSKLSWIEAYQAQSSQMPGKKVKELSVENSAQLSGLQLASSSFKYRSQSREKNLIAVRSSLKAISNLFKIHKDSGLLARSIMPIDSKLAEELLTRGEQIGDRLILGEIDNAQWFAYQGEGVSLDQYQAVLYGLVMTYKLVNDEQIKNEAKRLTKIMVDYLIKNSFLTQKELNKINDSQNVQFPNIWQAFKFESMAFILSAEEMFPGEYTEYVNSAQELSESAWLATYHLISNPVHGFEKAQNLMLSLAVYFEVQKNTHAKSQMLEVVNTIDYYFAHQKNIFFDSLIARIQPSKSVNKATRIQKGLYNFLRRSHRKTRLAELDLEKTTKELPNGESITVAATNLTPEQMSLDNEFTWKKSAQVIDTKESSNDKIENIGLDISLIYWMGMNSGIF